MIGLFDEDGDEKVSLQTNNEYAKNYNEWRKKEELHKLKTKYGDEVLSDYESTSSSEDENVEVNNEFEIEFLKTLSCLKTKDPSIYDENTKFFKSVDTTLRLSKEKQEKPMYLKDYERKLIIENSGQLSDEEDCKANELSLTICKEQEQLKNELKDTLENILENDKDNNWGGLFKQRVKTEEEKTKEEEEYKLWLAGQKQHLKDKSIENQLQPLKDFWNDPSLDEKEKFLRDYILKNRFNHDEENGYIPTYDEVIHDSDEGLSEDDNAITKQEEFEYKYNFRFEEPDQEFVKRYPRTMESSLRKKDDKRKMKREEVKERKRKEKMQKIEEIKQLKALKKREIEEKIEMLKEITGNNDIGFNTEDIEGDFDPEEHDKKMQSLFSEDFYCGPEEEQKPQFPDIDRELDLETENWDRWQGDNAEDELHEPHCEDDDFNMDCDYNPKEENYQDLTENTKLKKKRKRKSKFAKVVNQPKPVFNPNDKTFAQYLDEYYKLDCEDIIGNLPCRFKYREVIPNNFGLTVEEILLANDKELNRWCSLKKAIQYRPEHIEKYDKIAYERKAKDDNLKRKILPSLYASNDNKLENVNETDNSLLREREHKKVSNKEHMEKNVQKTESVEKQKRKRKFTSCGTKVEENATLIKNNEPSEKNLEQNPDNSTTRNKKQKPHLISNNETEILMKRKNLQESDNIKQNRRKNKNKQNHEIQQAEISNARLAAYGINPKKYRKKMKYKIFDKYKQNV